MSMDKYFTWDGFLKSAPLVIQYLPVTLEITLITLAIATILGMGVAAARVYKVPVLSQFCKVYLHIMRGIPYVVLLLLMYYFLPFLVYQLLGLDINGWDKKIFVVITFTTHEIAYIGEIFRAAVESVPKVQSEAAASVGLTEIQTFFRIIFPQSIKVAIPAYGANLVELFHNTAITYVIGVTDFIGRATTVGGASYHFIEPYTFVAIVYCIISILIQCLFKFLDAHYQFGSNAKIAGRPQKA